MTDTSFEKYHSDPGDEDCVYGKWGPGVAAADEHLWATEKCNNDDHWLTLCQEMISMWIYRIK